MDFLYQRFVFLLRRLSSVPVFGSRRRNCRARTLNTAGNVTPNTIVAASAFPEDPETQPKRRNKRNGKKYPAAYALENVVREKLCQGGKDDGRK